MSSIFGTPTNVAVQNCEPYGWIEGNNLRFCSQFEEDCNDLYAVGSGNTWASAWSDPYAATVAGKMMGQSDVHLRRPSQQEAADMYLFRLSFLPWNKAEWTRVHTNSGRVLPINPWQGQVLRSNGMTITKLVGLVSLAGMVASL